MADTIWTYNGRIPVYGGWNYIPYFDKPPTCFGNLLDDMSGLQVYYKMDGNVTDSSGNGNNGTPTDITYTTGKFATSSVFNGSTSGIVNSSYSPGTVDTNFTGSYSVALWFKEASLPSADPNTHVYANKMSSTIYGWFLGSYKNAAPDTDVQYRFFIRTSSPAALAQAIYTVPGGLSLNTWHHIAGVYDGTNALLYINGLVAATVSHTTGFKISSTDLSLGYWNSTSPDKNFLDGEIDDFQIWHRALSSTEIATLAAGTCPLSSSFIGPFDGYTFTAGYSLRRLSSSYEGDAIIVQRSSDSATQSIGFDANGDLDQSALTTFVGANDGYVTTWFDQSGNGYHVTLGTYSANGPQIVVSGVVATMSGCSISRPTTKWASADGKTVLRNASFSQTMPATNFTAVRLSSTTLTSRAPVVYDSSDIANARHLLYNSGKVDAPNDNWGILGSSIIYNSSSFDTNPKLLTAKFDGASSVLRANGTQILTGDAGSATHTGLKIGNLRNAFGAAPLANKYEWYGDLSELIFFQSDESSNYSTIEGKINTYFGLY